MTLTVEAVLFDLDGTLVDTAPDLAFCLNETLRLHGRPTLPFAQIRSTVSHGTSAMLQLGFGLNSGDEGFAELRELLLAIYRENLCQHSRLFPGMGPLLTILEERGLPWGIVTNKPANLTEPLVALLELDQRAACVVSGDTLPYCKPHPAPILHACALAGVAPGNCLYLGDALRDIHAGRAAGTLTLAARYGYLSEDEQPERWCADGIIDSPLELLDWLQ
jgi:N-acetyl-D-muramate 6-phosphate phosphatase